MKRPDIEAIKERCKKTTPGPWEIDNGEGYSITKVIGKTLRADIVGDCAQVGIDAEFIAHARMDIPALLAYIEELEKELGDDEPDEEAKYY